MRVSTSVAVLILRTDVVCLQALEPAELSSAISTLEAKLTAADEAYKAATDVMTKGSVTLR